MPERTASTVVAWWVRFSSLLSMLEASKRSVLEGLTTIESPMPGRQRDVATEELILSLSSFCSHETSLIIQHG